MLSNKEIRALYGQNAVISERIHSFWCTWIAVAGRSTKAKAEFDPVDFFCPDCPLCQILKESGIVVFDESIFDEETIE
jgi:hypothetical protein